MKKFSRWMVLSGLVLVALLLSLVLSVKPAKAAGIQISPLVFNMDISSTGSGAGKIIITNNNPDVLNYVVEVENFAGVTEDGAVTFAGKEEADVVTNLSDWFTFDAPKEGAIDPKKDKEISFTVAIPKGAEPGGHYAAIFAREVKKSPTGQAEIGIASRVGALVLVSVPGKVTRTADITNFTYPKFVWRGPNDLILNIKNTGTVHFDSKADVQLKSIFGPTTKVDMGNHTLIPTNDRKYVGTWASKYPFGYYKVTATALDGNKNPITTTGVIWAIPLIIVIPIIILIILLIIIVKYIKRHFKYQAKPVEETKPQL